MGNQAVFGAIVTSEALFGGGETGFYPVKLIKYDNSVKLTITKNHISQERDEVFVCGILQMFPIDD